MEYNIKRKRRVMLRTLLSCVTIIIIFSNLGCATLFEKTVSTGLQVATLGVFSLNEDPVPKLVTLRTKQKYPLNVALFFYDSPHNKYKAKVKSKCLKRGGEWVEYDVNVDLTDVSREIFMKGLEKVFENVSFVAEKGIHWPGSANGPQLPLRTVSQNTYDLTIGIRIIMLDPWNFECLGAKFETGFGYRVDILDKAGNYLEQYTSYGRYNGTGTMKQKVEGLLAIDIESYEYYTNFGHSGTKAFNEIIENIVSSQNILKVAQPEIQKRTLPAGLIAQVQFSDNASIIPNEVIDAGEEAILSVSITNNGHGTAFDVKLNASVDYKEVEIPAQQSVGDLQPGETREIKLLVKAGLDLADGKAPVTIYCSEKRGYDSQKVKLLVPTARLERPDIVITEYRVEDGNTGLAKGNGNGIPESGETVELTAFIQNRGPGKAFGVTLRAAEMNPGIKWESDNISIGAIPPGEIVKGKLAFSIPMTFDANEILASLIASDGRGVSKAEKKVALAFSKQSPRLEYAYRLLSRGKEVDSITNGEDYEIELTVRNGGKLAAQDVVLNANSSGPVTLDREQISLGVLTAGSSCPPQLLRFSVPRTFTESKLPLTIQLSQSGFSPSGGAVNVPVNVKSPRLSYEARLMSKSRGNLIEKGESAILELQVRNEGALPAESVRVSVESRDEDLSVVGARELVLGRVPVNSMSETVKFELATKRRISVGDKYLDVKIDQAEFSPVSEPYAIHITEESVAVVDLTVEERGRPPKDLNQASKQPPSITILSHQGGETVEGESLYLAADVSDARKVESVRVIVNGAVISLPDSGSALEVSRERKIRANIPLREGENKIAIYAYNSDNLSAHKELIITRKPEVDVDTPLITRNKNPDAVGVVIGISRFKNPDIPTVDYARRDAETMKQYLVHTLGLKESNIIELYDENALLSELKATIRRRLANRVSPGKSDVFIYYSGHGVPGADKAPYLVPYDFDSYAIEDTGYNLNDFYTHLSELKAKTVTVVLDACFSGSSEKGMVIKEISPVFLEVNNPVIKINNGVVITSSTGKQMSSWYHNKRHGLFTYYFLMGLRGAADANQDETVTVAEMQAFLDSNVPKKASFLYNREQTPQIVGNLERVLLKY